MSGVLVVGMVMGMSTVAQMPMSTVAQMPLPFLCLPTSEYEHPNLVMDFGDGVSHTMTINEGYSLLHAILRLIWLAVFFQMKFLTERK